MKKCFDVCIIGNGGIGTAIAIELSKRGPKSLKICLVGEPTRPGAASIAAGAMLNSFAEIEYGQLEKIESKLRFEKLNYAATKRWPAWIQTVEEIAQTSSQNILKFGTVIINNSAANELDDLNYNAIKNALVEYKEEFQEISPENLDGYYPDPKYRALKALFVPNEGYFASKKLFSLYEAAVSKIENLKLILNHANNYAFTNNVHSVKCTDGSEIESKVCIFANGAHSQTLINKIPEIKNKIPKQFFGNGNSLVVKSENIPISQYVIRSPNRGMACGIHSVPYSTNEVYIGASNSIKTFPTYQPMVNTVPNLIESYMSQINSRIFNSYIQEFRVGHRPTSVDTYPIIGQTSIPNLWVASGMKRDGLFCSPIIANQIVSEILDDKPMTIKEFHPERKPIFNLKKEEAIELTIQHYLSAGYQHGLKLPHSGWDSMIDDMLRAKIIKIYDNLRITSFGIPPEMLTMFESGHCSEYITI